MSKDPRISRWYTNVRQFARQQRQAHQARELKLGVPIPWQVEEGGAVMARRISDRIFDILDEDPAGVCTLAAGPFIVACEPPTARMVHIAFTMHSRNARLRTLCGLTVGGPDLVVQVVVEQQGFGAARALARDFLAAGTEIVWLIRPWAYQVAVFDGPREMELLTIDDTLRGSWLLPRFRMRLRRLFNITS